MKILGDESRARHANRLRFSNACRHTKAQSPKQESHMPEVAENAKRRTSDVLALTLYSFVVILLLLAYTYVPA